MKSSASNADKEKEGIRLEMHGGIDSDGQKQKAIVEFLCDISTSDERRRNLLVFKNEEDDGDKKGEEIDDKHGGKLKLVSWDVEEGTKVLRLDWITKYGCENVKNDKTGSSSGHRGEFLRLLSAKAARFSMLTVRRAVDLRNAGAVNAGVVVAVEEDGVGRRLRLQRRYRNTCNVDDGCRSPADVVEVQIRRWSICGGAKGDGDVFILESVRRRACFKMMQLTFASKAVVREVAAELVDALGLANEVGLGTAVA